MQSAKAIVLGETTTTGITCATATIPDGMLTSTFLATPNAPVMVSILLQGSTTPILLPASANAAGFGSVTFNNLPAGNYTVTVQDLSNMTTATSSPVVIPVATISVLTAVTSSTPISCNGGSDGTIILTMNGGSGFYTATATNATTGASQTQKGSNVANIIFTGLSEDYYYINAYDNNDPSCTIRTITQVVLGPIEAVVLFDQGIQIEPICFGRTGMYEVNIIGGTPPYTITATPQGAPGTQAPVVITGVPAGNVVIPNLLAGTYLVSATDSNNCTATPIRITLNTPPQLFVQPVTVTNETCPGLNNGTITITASGGKPFTGNEYSYSVVGPSGSFSGFGTYPFTFTGIPVGTYAVTVTDALSCTATTNVTISAAIPIVVGSPATQSIAPTCPGGSDGQIIVYASGGTPPLQYALNTATPSFSPSNSITGLAAGTYSVLVTDANGCPPITIDNILVPSVTFAQEGITVIKPLSCAGASDAIIKAKVLGGVPPVQYMLDGVVGPQANPVFTNLGAGLHTITIFDANTPPCTLAQSIILSAPSPLAINNVIPTTPTCVGSKTGSFFIIAGGGTPPYKYSVDGGLSYGSSDIISGLAAGTYSIIVKDANGCFVMITGVITPPLPLVIGVATTNVSSAGLANGSITITPSGGAGGYLYSINGGTTFSSSNTFTGLSTGTYKIVVKDANGCTVNATAVIQIGTGTTANVPEEAVSSLQNMLNGYVYTATNGRR